MRPVRLVARRDVPRLGRSLADRVYLDLVAYILDANGARRRRRSETPWAPGDDALHLLQGGPTGAVDAHAATAG